MKHIKTLNTQTLNNTVKKRRMRRVPDIMSVSLQDVLYCRKSDLREQKVIASQQQKKQWGKAAV